MQYFRLFEQKFKNPAVIFRAFGRKNKFLKNFEIIFKKIFNFEKSIILAYFSKNFYKPCVKFSRVWTKNTNCWKFREIFENFQKIS